jgi:hypothetical protein
MRAQLTFYLNDSTELLPKLICCVCQSYTYRAIPFREAGKRKMSMRTAVRARVGEQHAIQHTGLCSYCESHTIVSGTLREPNFMVVYSPRHQDHDRFPLATTIVRELALGQHWETLETLRIARGARQLATSLPRDARKKIAKRNERQREARRLTNCATRHRPKNETQIVENTRKFLRDHASDGDDDCIDTHDHRLALLVALEQLAMIEHSTFSAYVKMGATVDEQQKTMRCVIPLDDGDLTRALNCSVVDSHEATLALFPVANSAIVESASCGAYSMQTAATDRRLTESQRARLLMFANRTVRPLTSMMPLLAELAFMYTSEPSTE